MKWIFATLWVLSFNCFAQDWNKILMQDIQAGCDSMLKAQAEDDNAKHYSNMCLVHGIEVMKDQYTINSGVRTQILLDACTFYINKTSNFLYSPRKDSALECISWVAKRMENPAIEKNKNLCWDNTVDYPACLVNGPAEQQDTDESLIGIFKDLFNTPKCESCPEDD